MNETAISKRTTSAVRKRQALKHSAQGCDSVRTTARRLLLLQYSIFVENLDGVIKGSDSLPLHDFRVAIRRFRALLRIFKRRLADTSAPLLYKSYSEICSTLGPFRDTDVWIDFLSAATRKQAVDRSSTRTLLREERAKRENGMRNLRRFLTGREWTTTRRKTVFLLNTALVRTPQDGVDEPLRPFAARQLKRHLSRLAAMSAPSEKTAPEEIHELRKACRKARYCAEFFAPIFGGPVRNMANRLKNITTSLGTLHDIDSYEKRLARRKSRAAVALRNLLKKQREKSWDLFRRNWRELRREKLTKSVLAAMRKMK